MLHYTIPGFGELNLEHLVMDYNGTLAVDGSLLPGVDELLVQLSKQLTLHVITADTFGVVKSEMSDLPVMVKVLPLDDQDKAKQDYVRQLGAEKSVALGNGRNDRLMLETAALGVALVLGEGASIKSVLAADIVCVSIIDALMLLTNPKRLTATLRS